MGCRATAPRCDVQPVSVAARMVDRRPAAGPRIRRDPATIARRQSTLAMSTTTMKASNRGVPRLVPGDRLSRDEFERRYHAMPECKKAELIEGVVYMPSPVSTRHSDPHFLLSGWLFHYVQATPGVRGSDNATVRLDLDNEPQPDLLLRLLPEHGGNCLVAKDGYLEGPAELVVEVAASSASYDLHDKLDAYRRNGVCEYLVWRIDDDAVDWFAQRGGRFEPLPQHADGLRRSEVFPGLWLDVAALLRSDTALLLRGLGAGLRDPAHTAFVQRMRGTSGHAR